MIALCLIFHILSGAVSVAKPDLAQKCLYMVYSLCFVPLEVQDRGLAKILLTQKLSTKLTLPKSKLSGAPCNIAELWKAKDKQKRMISLVKQHFNLLPFL